MDRNAEPQARVFGSLAADYAAARPGYPARVFVEIARRLENREAASVLAIDVAAGAGAATAGLVERFGRVAAIEPSLPMLRRAIEVVAARRAWLGAACGWAETLPVRDRVADVVTVAQAFHWLDAAPALDEFARILRPGGILTLLWNIPQDTAFNTEVWTLVEEVNPGHKRPVTTAMRARPEALATHPGFRAEPPSEMAWSRELDLDRYVRYAFSWSYIGGALAPGDRDPFEARLRAIARTHFGTGRVVDEFLTVAHFARVVGAPAEGR